MRSFDLTAVLIYPNTRDVALASLGLLKVRRMLAERLTHVDFTYWPRHQREVVLSPRQGLLLGERSLTEVRRFDIVAFSVSYENDFVRLPRMLLAAGLPALARERKDAFPLVLCGGFTMSMNPLPIADFVDAVVVGEAEAVLERLLEEIETAKRKHLSKPAMLEALATIDGVYVPTFGETRVERVWSPVEMICPDPEQQAESHFGDMILVEVGRGCGRGCLFCAAGNLYRPVRMRSEEAIMATAGGARRVGLVGTALGDHPHFIRILERLAADGRGAGVGSLRVDEVTPAIAGLLARCGVRTATIAPEAGSDRLRRGIGKPISEQAIEGAVTALAEAGMAAVKLYFMTGLPGETDEDAEAIVELVRQLADHRGRSRLSIAVGPFVPKPHTAFQWCGFIDRRTFSRRRAILKRISAIEGCSVKLASYREAWLEAVLSKGERSLGLVLLEAAQTGRPLGAVLTERGIPGIHAALDAAKPLPWDFIESGVPRKGLMAKYRGATGAR